MKDLSYLGRVDASTLQYAEQLERSKYWFERSDLDIRKDVLYAPAVTSVNPTPEVLEYEWT